MIRIRNEKENYRQFVSIINQCVKITSSFLETKESLSLFVCCYDDILS